MEIRQISDKKNNFGFYLKATWYFESFKDKFIMIILGLLGMWKFFELLYRWIT